MIDKEILTEELALEYRDRVLKIDNRHKQYIDKVRKIVKELRRRCGVTEIEAINILSGNHIQEYVHKQKMSLLQQEEEAADRTYVLFENK